MPAPKRATPKQYQAAYERLSQIADELESGDSNLDQILPRIQEAQQAYAICQERIQALWALLEKQETTS